MLNKIDFSKKKLSKEDLAKEDFSKDNLCYVIVYSDFRIIQKGIENRGGICSLAYAKSKGYKVKRWDMAGEKQLTKLPKETQKEIQHFINSFEERKVRNNPE